MANQQNRRLLALCSAAMLAVTGCAAIGSAKTVMAKGNSARTNEANTTHTSTSTTTAHQARSTMTSVHHTTTRKTAATTTATAKKTAAKATRKTSAVKKLKYKNGTYTGVGETRIGAVQVRVTLKNDKITACKITGYSTHYSIGYIDPILPDELMQRQDINKIDIVSGATLSTADFYYAVQQCLQEARRA